MDSILSRLTSADVRTDPFPHLLVRNAIPDELSARLLEAWPPLEAIAKGEPLGSNKRLDHTVTDVRKDPDVAPVWREFLEAQASEAFLRDALRIFKPWIDERYPQLAAEFGPSFERMRHGVRFAQSREEADALVDAHISVNTPVTGAATSVRSAHVDDPRKLFSGLLYLRPADDADSKGGELVLYRYRGAKRVFVSQMIDEKLLEPVATVPYERGTLVFFLNTIDSLHGVTPRLPTPHVRKFVNLITELEKPLFDIRSLQEKGLPKLLRRLRSKFAKKKEEAYV